MHFDLQIISLSFREKQYAISAHANDEMQNDNVSTDFLEEAIGRDKPKIIEKYQYSCLILGWVTSIEPVHAVVAFGTEIDIYDTPIVVTVYRPDKDPENRWKENYAKRKKKFFIQVL